MALVLTIILFIVIFGLIILLHEGGHFLVAKREGMKVREFAFGFPPRLFSKRHNGTQYSLNLIPLGGYVSILGEDDGSKDPDAFGSKSPWARWRVAMAGIGMNLLLAWILLILFFWLAPLTKTLDAVAVASVLPSSAAEQAGIKVNDFITGANGQPISSDTALTDFTRSHKGETVELTITRNGSEQKLTATLGSGESAPLGVSIADVGNVPEVPWYTAPWYALVEMWSVTLVTFSFLGQLVLGLFGQGSGDVTVQQVSGPVGIFGLLRQIQLLGAASLLHFAAMLSLAVGLFNLLPIPALDGGRAFLLLYEAVFKKPVFSAKTEGLIHAAGFAVLLLFILVITYFDIRKL